MDFKNLNSIKIIKIIMLLIFIFFVFFCSNNSNKNLFDRADERKIYVNKSKKQIRLKLIKEVKQFVNKKGKTVNFGRTRAGTICEKDSTLYLLDSSTAKFYIYKLNNFSDKNKPDKIIMKPKGKGPNDLNIPIDICYDNRRDLIYIADLNNYCINFYDKNFNEIDRVNLKFRPFRIHISDNDLYVSNYTFTPDKYCVEVIDLNTREQKEGLFSKSEIGTLKEKRKRNTIQATKIACDSTIYLAVRNYPYYHLYLCDKNNVYKTFSSPFLHNKKLPKPKTIIRKGKKKTWGISAIPSIDYSRENNLIFALTTMGWRELAEENDLFRAVIIFDEEGNTLCEHKIEPFKGGEDSICFHEASNTLFYFSYGCIKVYKIKK